MGLIINPGSPNWWLSPDIWVTAAGDPSTIVAAPIAGQNYDVVVQVNNPYDQAWPGWNLYACWVVPTAGAIAIPPDSKQLSTPPFGSPINVPALSSANFTFNWTPSFVNGGHECLIAVAYDQNIGFVGSLNGDSTTGDYSCAQHNLGVLPVGTNMSRFHYPFQVFNVADEERELLVEVRQAPLAEIERFHRGFPAGLKLLERPGKVEDVGIFDHADRVDSKAATPIPSCVRIAPHSGKMFAVSGKLEKGNALLHVTQSFRGRVVGGLSVLVMAGEK